MLCFQVEGARNLWRDSFLDNGADPLAPTPEHAARLLGNFPRRGRPLDRAVQPTARFRASRPLTSTP